MKNPKALRAQAKKLIEEADRLEAEQLQKIGKLTLKHLESQAFDLENLRAEIKQIQEGHQ
jgi:hypothetical protein